ncbi:MAG: NAD-dependent epimerase/dehydratase family protein [Nitrososphaerales archaeon]
MKLRITVTGGAGFVGRFVVKQLRSEGHEVTSLDITATDDGIKVDVTNRPQLRIALEKAGPEVVVHLAALAGATGKGGGAESLKRPYDYLSVNINATLSVFETCRDLQIRHVLCMSSFSPYGTTKGPINEETPLRPSNPYGTSKACVEDIAKCYSTAYGIKTVIFRPPLISGEGQKEMNALREFATSVLQGAPIIILGEGKHVREFVHPQDIAIAFSAGIRYVFGMESPFEVFVLGNEPISMKKLAELVIMSVGKGSVKFEPSTNQAFDQFTDHAKATRVLGWVPAIGVDEIVSRVVRDVKYSLV